MAKMTKEEGVKMAKMTEELENNVTNVLTNKEDGSTVDLKKKIELIRKKRTPLEAQRGFIGFERDPNYHYRWVNAQDNRIPDFRRAGYELVDRNGKELEVDERMQDPSWRQSALSQHVGGNTVAYAMRIPKELYDEDQAKKFSNSFDIDQQLKLKAINDRYNYTPKNSNNKLGFSKDPT